MRWITFNKVYLALVLVAIISAVIVPKPFTDKGRAQVQRLFAPVSYPVRIAAGAVYRRVGSAPSDLENPTGAPRTYQQVVTENRELRTEIAHITEQLRKLQQINADREALGSLREFCRPMRVVGNDPGLRKAISLQGDVKDLKPGMAVLCRDGLVGRIDRVGWSGGAQAQLINDGAFRILARFGRLEASGDAVRFRILSDQTMLLEGDGKSGLVARMVSEKDATAAGITPGDWAMVADEDYPAIAHGYRIGKVTYVRPGRKPGFVEIGVASQRDLANLRDVMVLAR